MKYLTGINITTNKDNHEFDGYPLITRKSDYKSDLSDLVKIKKDYKKYFKSNFYYALYAFLILTIAIIYTLIRTMHKQNIDFPTLVSRYLYLVITCSICAGFVVIFIIIILILRNRGNKLNIQKTYDSALKRQQEDIDKELNLPKTYSKIDLYAFIYVIEKNEPKFLYYNIVEFALFRNDDVINLVSQDYTFSFNYLAIKEVVYTDKKIWFESWNKIDEPQKYGVFAAKYGNSLKGFYDILIDYYGETFAIRIPIYDGENFFRKIGLDIKNFISKDQVNLNKK